MFTALISRGPRPAVAALMLVLAACQQQEPPVGSAAPERTPVPGIAVEPESSGAAVVATLERPSAPAAIETRPLRLDIPADILEEGKDTGFPEQPSRLPDLFDKKKKTGTAVSGELLFEEGEGAALETMSGAKITIQIPVEN